MDAGVSASPTTPRRRLAWSSQRADGQVLIIFALFSVVLIGALALSIDAGYLMAERRQAQSAADAGALAAAKAVLDGKAASVVTATGQGYATYNAGVANSGVTVTQTAAPTGGAYAGTNYVTVTVTKNVSRFFIGAVYSGAWQVTATATAGIDTSPGNYALVALDKITGDDIYGNGTTNIIIKGTHASAMANTNISTSGNFNVTGSIDAHGTVSGAGTAPDGVHQGYPYIVDPLAGTPKPPSTGAKRTQADINNAIANHTALAAGYYDGLSVDLGPNESLTLGPGLHYFHNTPVHLKNTSSLSGTDVMLYFDGSSDFDPKNGTLNIRANTTSAAYSGGQVGMAVWIDNTTSFSPQGNSNVFFQGIFYAPNSDVGMNGNTGNDTVNGQVIVKTLHLVGASDFKLTYTKYVNTNKPQIYLLQ